MNRKRVVILGATGSIGESALKVARDIPERMEIVGLAAKSNAQKLAAAANEVRPESVCLVDETQIDVLRRALDYEPRIFSGEAGLLEIACLTNADMVLVAIVGTGGLRPALAAIKAGKDLAVASKEILVMAGEIVMREAREKSVHVLPVDSEHNAIFQCLEGKQPADVRRIILTASGGPFRETPRAGFRFDHAGAGVKTSDLEYGTEDHHRFRDVVQQGPGDDRGALAFWRGDEARRGRHSSAKHRPFDGRVHRRFHARAIELFEHVFPDSIRRDLAGSRPELVAAARFFEVVEVGIFHSALRRFSGIESGAPRGRDRRHIAGGDECRQRNRGRGVFRSQSAVSGNLARLLKK